MCTEKVSCESIAKAWRSTYGLRKLVRIHETDLSTIMSAHRSLMEVWKRYQALCT